MIFSPLPSSLSSASPAVTLSLSSLLDSQDAQLALAVAIVREAAAAMRASALLPASEFWSWAAALVLLNRDDPIFVIADAGTFDGAAVATEQPDEPLPRRDATGKIIDGDDILKDRRPWRAAMATA